MKATKELNIKGKSGYFFTDMTNINNFDPDLLIINVIAVFDSGSPMYEISYNEEFNTLYVVFNNITCVLRKSGKDKYLIFCKTQENKKMLENYTKIFVEIKRQIVLITDGDVNIPVRVIAIRCIFKENEVYYPQITLHSCSYDYEDCDN